MTAVAERTGVGSALDAVLGRLPADLQRWHAPGVELAAVKGGELVLADGFGSADLESGRPATATTLFHHGSCGKAYTAMLATLLADDGVLDLDAPVRRWIPELQLPDPVIAERVTLRDLLSHRSGLARNDLAWILNPSWFREDVVQRVAHLPMCGDLRAQWQYSNFGYALTGIAIERVTGSSYAEQLQSRLFEPAGLTRTFPVSRRDTVAGDLAAPYLTRDGEPVLTEWREMQSMAPAGGIITCAEDSVRWLLLQLGHGPLDAAVVERTHHLQVPVPAEAAQMFPELRLYGYAMGWVVATLRGRRLLWHSGGVDGFTTYALLMPDDDIGAVASINLHLTQDLPLALVLDIADALLGESEETSWTDRMFSARSEQPDESAAAAPPATRQGDPTPPAHTLDSYAGTFSDGGYGDVEVRVVDGALAFRVGEFDVESAHRHFDTWDLNYAALDAKATASFTTDADGAVSEVVVEFEVSDTGSVRYQRRQVAGESS